MNDIMVIILCMLGLVFVVLPAIVFVVWFIKEYIKFVIYIKKEDE